MIVHDSWWSYESLFQLSSTIIHSHAPFGPFHLISTPPPPPALVDEFSQNLPPKKKKIKVPTQHPPQKLTDFSFPPQKKTNFSSNPSEKAAKIKGSGRINPSETTFLAPSEKLINRAGVCI